MKESETKCQLRFLEKNLFSRDFYFHKELFRSLFQRVVQIHVISNQMGKKEGYEMVGNWVSKDNKKYEIGNLLRNDFDEEKNKQVSYLKQEIRKSILKCDDYSRYSLLGFYVKIVGSQTTFEEFLNRILNEIDERICPKSIKNFASNLLDIVKIQNEIKDYLAVEKDLETALSIKSEMELFLKEKYFPWIQSFNKYDSIPDDININYLLLIDPNILKMMRSIRESISKNWDIHLNFDINKTYDLKDSEFVTIFQKSWRNYFKSPEKIKKLMKIENKFYKNGWLEFEEISEEINQVCDQYMVCLGYLTEILIRKKNSETLNKPRLIKAFEIFYKSYSSLFAKEFHVDCEKIVNYEEKSNLLIEQMLNNKELIKLKNETISFENLERPIKINFLLNIVEYLHNVDEISDFDIEVKNKEIINNLIHKQIVFLVNLQNKSIEIDRIIKIFILHLNNYKATLQKWNIFAKFNSINESLNQINKIILICNEFSLEINNNSLDKEASVIICDMLEEQKNFISNIKYLPLYTKNSKFLSFLKNRGSNEIVQVEESNLLNCSEKLNHSSYEIIAEALEILASLVFKHKDTSVKNALSLCEKYFDVLGEMIKQLDNQLECKDLDSFKKAKLRLFEYCTKINDLDDLIEYMNLFKKYIVLTIDKNEENSIEKTIQEFQTLNNTIGNVNKLELSEFYRIFDKHYQEIRSNFIQKKISIEMLMNEIRDIAQNKNPLDEINLKSNILKILAGLLWIYLASDSKMVNKSGNYIEESGVIELKPDIIQVLGCFRLLALHQIQKTSQTIKNWLANIPKQVVEIIDAAGKSIQISLISMLFAIIDYEVTIVSYSEYLESKNEVEIYRNFASCDKELVNIRFATLEKLIQEECEKDYNYNEQVCQLVEQIVFKGEYDEEYGISAKGSILNEKKKHIYIIDEIDSLISSKLEDFVLKLKLVTSLELANGIEVMYKKAKQIVSIVKNKKCTAIEKFQLIVRQNNAIEKLQSTLKQDSNFSKFMINQKDLFTEFVNELWKSAVKVANYYSDNIESHEKGRNDLKEYLDKTNGEPLFRLSKDGQYCEYYSNNKWSHKIFPEYLNAFFYLELFSKQSKFIEKNPLAYGYMKLNCGKIHYSSIILEQAKNLIIGITNSFKKRDTQNILLSSIEKEMLSLDLFGIKQENITYFPTMFDAKRVKFESFTILKTKSEWEKAIYELCEKLSNEQHACLVWFKNENDLKKIFNRLLAKEPFILTNSEISVNQFGERKVSLNEFFEKNESEIYDWIRSLDRMTTEHCSGQPGKITLAMCDYARSIDFECNANLKKIKGMHIIQTWFSEDPKEELQIKERTSRNGAPAAYIQLHNLEDLKTKTFYKLNKTEKLTVDTTYDQLRLLADESIKSKYLNAKNNIESNKKKSNELFKWIDNARIDRDEKISSNTKADIKHSILESYTKLI